MKVPGRRGRTPESTDVEQDATDDPPQDRPARSPRQRLYLALFATVSAIIVLAVAWIVITGLMARSRLQAADDELPGLKRAISAGRLSEARTLATHISAQAASARRLTSGPAWWTASNLPLIGTPLRTARVVTAETQRVSAEVPRVLGAADRLVQGHRDNQGLDRKVVDQVTTSIDAAATTTSRADDRVAAAAPSWLPIARDARSRLLRSLHSVDGQLAGAKRTVSVLGPVLGTDRPQTYFVGFMNTAESRGLGGLPGAFAILDVDRGRFRFTHFGSDPEFHRVHTGLDLGAQYNARYGQDDPANEYANSDVSPDLRDAARIWSAMWQKKSGQPVDGVLVLDPTTLSYLLKASGPAALSDGTKITSANVVEKTESSVYAAYSSDSRRNAYLRSVAAAAAKTMVSKGGRDPLRLFSALATAVSQRRFAVWSADPTLESKIIDAGYGAVLQPSSAFTGFTVVNAAGGKLDYYLDRRMSYTRASCAAGATAVAKFRLTNGAPRSGLPGYVTQRVDAHPAHIKAGDNRLLVTYYASSGARIVSTTLNGKPVAAATAPEKGLVTVTVDVELPVGATRLFTVTVREPAPSSALQVLDQPLVRRQVTTVDRHCDPAG